MENLQHWLKTPKQFHSHFFDFLKVIFSLHIAISLAHYWRSKCHCWVIPHNLEFLMVSVGAGLLPSNVLLCQHKIYLDVSIVKCEKWSQKTYMCYQTPSSQMTRPVKLLNKCHQHLWYPCEYGEDGELISKRLEIMLSSFKLSRSY